MEHTINWSVVFGDTTIENGIRINEFLFVPIVANANRVIWATKPRGTKLFLFFRSADAALSFASKWLNAGNAEFWENVRVLEKARLIDVYNYMDEPMPTLREKLRLESVLKKVDWDN